MYVEQLGRQLTGAVVRIRYLTRQLDLKLVARCICLHIAVEQVLDCLGVPD